MLSVESMHSVTHWIAKTAATDAQVLVAIGTLILALWTWKMASATREMARETKRSVDVSSEMLTFARQQAEAAQEQATHAREGLLATIQPLLVGLRGGIYGEGFISLAWFGTGDITLTNRSKVWVYDNAAKHPDTVFFSVPMKNVGPGVALIDRAVLRCQSLMFTEAYVEEPIIQPNELSRITFGVPRSSFSTAVQPPIIEFSVDVTYSTARGGELTKTGLHFLVHKAVFVNDRNSILLPGREKEITVHGT